MRKDRGKILDKIDMNRVLTVLEQDIKPNPELVQILNLGPFQHIVD